MLKLRSFILAITASVLFIHPVHAQEAFDIQNFQTDIEMSENGAINVTETIQTNFTAERHGIFRDIQTQGISINIISVTDNTGNPWQYSIEPFAEGTRVKIGDPNKLINGEQVYKIKYDVKGAIRFFDDHEELYWNSTGNSWPVAILKASTTVKLPSNTKGATSLTFKCYTGPAESTAEDCVYKYNETSNSVTFNSNVPFPPYSGMTVVAGVPPKTFEKPTTLEIKSNPSGVKAYLDEQFICSTDCVIDVQPGDHTLSVKKFGYSAPEKRTIEITKETSSTETFELKMQLWLSILTKIIALFFLCVAFEPIYTYRKKGKDPKGRGVLVPQYEPPDKLLPAEVGALIDERVDMRDLTSTIVDLCVRGYLKIKVLPKENGLLFKTDDYELIRLDKPKSGDRGLSEFEKLFVDKIFGSGSTKKVSDMQNTFYTSLPLLKDTLYKNLVDKEYFPASPGSVRKKYFIKAALFIFGSWFIMIPEMILFQTGYSFLISINGWLTLLFAYFMPQKTPKGVEAREHILGFRHYMDIAETDRVRWQEKQNIFYEYLPYAMAFNIADKWSNAFKDIYKQPPQWFEGYTGAFLVTDFTHRLSSVSRTISTSFASHPSSSGGSSGFSGGFSGGGSGGGGGGSW